MNLITQPKKQWQQIPFSKQRPRWRWDDGRINQQVASTGKKFPTGFALITNVGEDYNHLKCVFSPGNVYHSGIIFNYQDKENFMLAVVNNLSTSYKGYQIMIGEVLKGNFSSVCLEKYNGRLEADCVLELFEFDEMLQVKLNNNEVFEWEKVGFDRQSKVGLYTQQNKDTQFFELEALENDNSMGEMPDEAFSDPSTQLVQDELTVLPEQDPALQYLKLKPPAAKTQVEFTEVFTVPLDSFYDDLYNNPSLKSNSTSRTSVRALTHKLDFRPRTWYRRLRDLLAREEQVEQRINIFQKRIEKLRKAFDEESDDGFDDLFDDLKETEEGYQDQVIELNQIRDDKFSVFAETKSHGYELHFDSVPESISEKGYNFYITGGKPVFEGYKPILVDIGTDFNDDKTWQTLSNRLKTNLYESAVLSINTKQKFEEELSSLKSYEDSTILNDKVAALTSSIESYQADHDAIDSSKFNPDIQIWNADKNWITSIGEDALNRPGNYTHKVTAFQQSLINNSTQYSLDPNHPDFRKNTVRRVNLKRLILEIGYSEQYGGSGIGVYYPDLGISGALVIKMTFYPNSGTTFHGESMSTIVDQCKRICTKKIEHYESLNLKLVNDKKELDNKIEAAKAAKEQIIKFGLFDLRKDFILKWNKIESFDSEHVTTNIIKPDVDPLTDLISGMREGKNPGETINHKTFYFDFMGDGFYNQDGQSLLEFSKTMENYPGELLALTPGFNDRGVISRDIGSALINPTKGDRILSLPIIKFVETYETEIIWKGYGIGELSHSFNLFPGETKELVIEKATKIHSKTEEAREQSNSTATKTTSSFEDKLEDELTSTSKASQELKEQDKSSETRSESSEYTSSKSKKFDASMSYGGVGGFGASASMSLSQNSSSKKNKAFNASQSNDVQKANNQSKEVLSKNVVNAIKKASSDTSRDNKVEVTSTSSETYEDSFSKKEIIKIENPNIGRTINYNFFQLQNIYEVSTKLVDVKVVIDPRIEVIEGSGISDMKVFELEEFGKIFPNLDQSSDHAVVLAAIVARQVFKHYVKQNDGITSGNGAVRLKEGSAGIDKDQMNTLNFSLDHQKLKDGDYVTGLLKSLKQALDAVKKVDYRFSEVTLLDRSIETVNSGAYYLESELGMRAATEPYLEERRDIETYQKRAELAHLEAQTEAGVFFSEVDTEN